MDEPDYNPLEHKAMFAQGSAEENGSRSTWFADIKPIPLPDPLKEEPMEPQESTFVEVPTKEEVLSSTALPYACGICEETFKTVAVLSQHISVEHSLKTCTDCNNVYNGPKGRHTCAPKKQPQNENMPGPGKSVKKEQVEILLEESAINEPREKNSSLYELLQEVRGRPGKKYACKVCKVSFWQLPEAQKHAERYRDPPHQCKICKKLFHSEMLCSIHEKKHKTHQPHKCDYCDETFPSKYLVKRHAATHTKAVEDFLKHTCGDCGEIFANRGQLDAHRKMLDELHQCHFCTRSFRLNKGLYQHLLTHPEFCPHKCHLCEAAFKQKNDLKRHLFDHRQKAFECDFCSRRFTQMYTLRDHQMSHAPFQCHACGALFPLFEELQRHMKDENHEYGCNVCNEGFQHKRDLRNHLLAHANGNAVSV